MKFKAQLLDSAAVERAIKRISFEIVEKNHGTDGLCLIGIKRRGISIAETIRSNILKNENINIPTGTLDITLYRDDLEKASADPAVKSFDIDFDINDKTVILVDDVIFTGRTIRAAIDAVFSIGRPKKIQVVSLIDRGHRDLPIKADYVGKNIPTSLNEVVKVSFPEFDNCPVCVSIYDK